MDLESEYDRIMGAQNEEEIEAQLRFEALPTGVWIEVTEQTPFPKTNEQFLVKNYNQGGTIKLMYWRETRQYFVANVDEIWRPHNPNIGTHFMIIPK